MCFDSSGGALGFFKKICIAFQKLITKALKLNKVKILTPLLKLSKVDIIKLAKKMNVPINQTWSCYQGQSKPCGKCDSCKIRNKALLAVK